jgi:hypothetical protein
MTRLATISLTGESGKKYEFSVYPRSNTFNAEGAVYLITKRRIGPDGGGSHQGLYIGVTGDLSDRPLNQERKPCFDRHGANCICLLVEKDYETRCMIEADLQHSYALPCNP